MHDFIFHGCWWNKFLFMLLLFLATVSPSYEQSNRPGGRNACVFHQYSCRIHKNKHCPPGKICTGVKPNPDNTSSSKCLYICKSEEPPTETGQNISTEQPTSRNDTNYINTTADTLNTTTTSTIIANTSTALPTHCSDNYRCKNGGYCLHRNRTVECVCPKNWTGIFCHEYCAKKCQNDGKCIIHGKEEKCQCRVGFVGLECENVRPEPQQFRQEVDIWYIPVLSICAVVVVALFLVVIMQKLRWRSLFITKLLHFFQPYEDDDGKQFDAFISFRASNRDYTQSEDEKFVLRVLQPMLENVYQHKVCVHYRDFPPGETIANNIMWAVENSRRTILILSPLYVESEWARLEYQKAQQEMLQLRHKIIPVIFEDISNTRIEDPTLKHILSSVTYIIYPKDSDDKANDKFWQMLQLALPKKRSLETETSSTSSHQPVTLSSSQTLVSQESWQSGRTDVTDISEDIEMNEVRCNDHVTLSVNELEKNRINATLQDPKTKGPALNNNADRFISLLEGVS